MDLLARQPRTEHRWPTVVVGSHRDRRRSATRVHRARAVRFELVLCRNDRLADPVSHADERRQDLADRAPEHGVGQVVEVGGIRVHDDDLRSGVPSHGHQAGGGVHGQRRADGEEHVAPGGADLRPDQVVGAEALLEQDRVGLQDPATRPAGRVVLTGTHAVEGPLHGRRLAAAPAPHRPHRPVDLDDLGGIRAGDLVQPVGVLGDQRVELSSPLEVHQRGVTAVRLRTPRPMTEAGLPGGTPHLGIAEVRRQARRPLGRRVPRPHAVGPAEVGDPRVRRDAGTGQDGDGIGDVDPGSGSGEVGHGDSRLRGP